MNKQERQTQQMLTSVASHIQGNVSLFPKNSIAIQETFVSEVKILDGLTSDQEAAETALRMARQARDEAVASLKSQIGDVAILAATINSKTLVLPRNASVPQLIHIGRSFLRVADSIKKELSEHGFPDDFAETLAVKIENCARCIDAYKTARGARSGAIRNWSAQLAVTLAALTHVDVVARIAFKDDVQAQTSYEAARTVRKVKGRKEVTETEEKPPDAAAAATAAA